MGSAGEPESGAIAAVSPGAGGVVPRIGLFGRLGARARVTVVSAPAGSGKTVLLRSWIGEAGVADRAAWVPVGPDERDPQRFWASVLGALRGTAPGSGLVRELTAAPDLDGWAVVERLLKDLAPLAEPVWLVVDDVHLLGPDQALRQLELLMMRAPDALRFVLCTRHDLRLGLHRLRLEGQLAEIRAGDLRFSVAEARELFAGAGVELADPAVAMLHERTEGWAAGLRLAALSLAGHPDPGRFAAEFSGSERTVAEYLLDEVLDRQPEDVRRLLLRTSVLERVSGPLADALAGGSGGERVLQELEGANAFVVSLDAGRSWFRYHHLFADLLQLELRRTAPGEVTGLHGVAAQWFAEHGFPVEAIRHAQAAQDWGLAARLLAGHWPGLHLGGQAATVHAILAGFPAGAAAADAELAAVAAADELAQGSLEAAERYLEVAARGAASVPAARRGQAQVLLGIIRLLVARHRGNPPAVAEEARRLQATAEAPEAAPGLGEELRALALISLGSAEYGAARFEDAAAHLEQGAVLARRVGRPYLEFTGLAYQAPVELERSFARAAERGRQAVELAERHGWTDEPAAGSAYIALAGALIRQGRPDEAEPWVQRAERTVRPEAEPVTAILIHSLRAMLELARGRVTDALAACRAAERLSGHLAAPHGSYFVTSTRACCCTPWCAWATRRAPSRPWAACVTRTATAARSASPRRCCGWPRTTRARRPPRWRRFWTAPLPWSGRTGWLAFSCWRRSSGTHSATGPPPGARSSVPSISPSPIACSSRSSSTVRRGCWSATPGTAPNTRPWSRRSSPCFHHWSQAPRNRPPMGIRGPGRYWEAGSPPVAKSGLGEIVPPS